MVRWVGDPTPEDFERFFASQRALLRRGEPYVQVADASRAHVMSSMQRRLVAEFSRETSDDAARLCQGTAVVIANTVVRGALTAVTWLVKLPYPLAIVSTMAEGIAQCRVWSERARIPFPRDAA